MSLHRQRSGLSDRLGAAAVMSILGSITRRTNCLCDPQMIVLTLGGYFCSLFVFQCYIVNCIIVKFLMTQCWPLALMLS